MNNYLGRLVYFEEITNLTFSNCILNFNFLKNEGHIFFYQIKTKILKELWFIYIIQYFKLLRKHTGLIILFLKVSNKKNKKNIILN